MTTTSARLLRSIGVNLSIQRVVLAGLLFSAAGPSSALGANGQPVQQWSCTRLSGGPIHDLTITVDVGARTLSVAPDGSISPDTDLSPVTFKDDSIEWSFMRGYAVLSRRSGTLDWDDTGEYDYLENIGHADAGDSEDNYRGTMQCKILGPGGNH
ncbi:MAG TPA: hypothetical protein VMU08_04220 [Rhizomicrobium sp.]|nr:hypothetical protein [Rhizomicrobium sp.]